MAKAAPNDPAHTYTARAAADLSRVTNRLTDTANMGKNRPSQHLMHSMQPKMARTLKSNGVVGGILLCELKPKKNN